MNTKLLKIISIPLITGVNFLAAFLPYLFIIRRMRQQNIRLSTNSDHVNESAAVATKPSSPSSSSPSHHQHNLVISPNMKRFLTLANFFCGGVFLATCFVGLYPNVMKKFAKIQQSPNIPHYPYEALSLAFGFFFVWLLEIVVHACLHSTCHSTHDVHELEKGDGGMGDHETKGHEHGHSHGHSHNHEKKHPNHSTSDTNKLINQGPLCHTDSVPMTPVTPISTEPCPEDKLLCEDVLLSPSQSQPVDVVEVEVGENIHPHDGDEAHSHMPIKGNLLGSIMLTFALGSHSIIEGLGFALVPDFSTTLNMLITVLIHESVCAFSLGVNLASKKTKLKMAIILTLTFSILIPVGLGIGLFVKDSLQENLQGDIITGLFQGIAAGTFLYVVFMEILPHELLNNSDQFLKAVMMMMGFAVIGGMKAAHSHSDSPSYITNGTSSTNLPTFMSPSSLSATRT